MTRPWLVWLFVATPIAALAALVLFAAALAPGRCAALPPEGRQVTYYERPGALDAAAHGDGTLTATLNGFPCHCERAEPSREAPGLLAVEYACPRQGKRFSGMVNSSAPPEEYLGNGSEVRPVVLGPASRPVPSKARLVTYDEDLGHLFGPGAGVRARVRETICDAAAGVRVGEVRRVPYHCPELGAGFVGFWRDGTPELGLSVPVFVANGSDVLGPFAGGGAWDDALHPGLLVECRRTGLTEGFPGGRCSNGTVEVAWGAW